MDKIVLGHWRGKLKFVYLLLVLFAALGSFSRSPIESLVWALIYGITFVWIALELHKIIYASAWVYLIFLFPLLVMMSTFWSEEPSHTFRISIHVFMTALIATWIGLNYSPIRIFWGLATACSIGLLGSLLVAVFPIIPAYSEADHFFIGMYTQKNVLGRSILLLSLSVLILGAKYHRMWLAWPLALLLMLPLLETQSATSTIFYFVVLLFPIFNLILTASLGMRQALTLGMLALALLGLGLWASIDLSVLSPVLESLGKDATLTGRTYLWSMALKMFELNPLLGIGYDAFWFSGNIEETKQIWSKFGVLNGFHNTFFEVLVALGVVGAIVFLISILAYLSTTYRWMMGARSAESLGAMVLIVMTILMSSVEIMSFREFDTFYLLPCAFYVISIAYLKRPEVLHIDESDLAI